MAPFLIIHSAAVPTSPLIRQPTQIAGSQKVMMLLGAGDRTLLEGYLVKVISVSDGLIEFEWKKLKD